MTEKQDIFTIMGGRVKMRRGIYNPTSDAVWLAAFVDDTPKTVLDVDTSQKPHVILNSLRQRSKLGIFVENVSNDSVVLAVS